MLEGAEVPMTDYLRTMPSLERNNTHDDEKVDSVAGVEYFHALFSKPV